MELIYARSFFEKESLQSLAKAYLAMLPPETTVLLSIGSSGCSIASAMLALTDRPYLHHVSVRKQGESSHSAGYAGYFNRGDFAVIVDDFVSTGNTVNNLVRWAKARGLNVTHILVHNSSTIIEDNVPVIQIDENPNF